MTVLLGSASLLGIGYLLMRRFVRLAVALVGLALILVLGVVKPEVAPIVLAAWWLVTMLETLWLTRRMRMLAPGAAARGRLWATRAAVAVVFLSTLATVALVRGVTGDRLETARAHHVDGDCGWVVERLDGAPEVLGFVAGDQLVAAKKEAATCWLLENAPRAGASLASIDKLERYLDRPNARFSGAGVELAEMQLAMARYTEFAPEQNTYTAAAVSQIRSTLKQHPGESDAVRKILNAHLDHLSEMPSCEGVHLNDALTRTPIDDPDGPKIAAVADVAEPVAADAAAMLPGQVLKCARDRRSSGDLEGSQAAYERFVGRYPDNPHLATAKHELYDVGTRIQLEQVTDLIGSGSYCADPKPYRAAHPYRGRGPHAMVFEGIDTGKHRFPRSWTSDDATEASLVVCVDKPSRGPVQDTCLYEGNEQGPGGYVSFHAKRFRIVAYEIRTGKAVSRYARDIGDPCPWTITWSSSISSEPPPSDMDSDFTSADVRSMFDGLVDGPG